MRVTFDTFVCCQHIVQDAAATTNEFDAAGLAIQAYRLNGTIDHHVAGVLIGYAQRHQQQDRWGK